MSHWSACVRWRMGIVVSDVQTQESEMSGDQILLKAASLGPEGGLSFLVKLFATGISPQGFIRACASRKDPKTGNYKPGTPTDIVVLAEAVREQLLA